jgi:hypothetical protein
MPSPGSNARRLHSLSGWLPSIAVPSTAGRGAAVHDRPKPRTIQVPMPAFSTIRGSDILDQREPRADGEAEDRRVDEKSNAWANQYDDDEAPFRPPRRSVHVRSW